MPGVNRATPLQVTTRILILIGLIALVVGGILYEIHNEWNAAVLSTLISGGVVTLLCIGVNGAWLAGIIFRKRTLLDLNMMVMVILAGAIVGGVNWYAQRHYKRFDATEASRYSLSSQTLNLLESLEKEVTAYAFFTKNAALYQDFPFVQLASDMLEEYQGNSTKLKVKLVDHMKDPKGTRKLLKGLDVDSIQLNSVIFASGEGDDLKTKVVNSYDMVFSSYSPPGGQGDDYNPKKFKGEDAFTSAIQTILDDSPSKVYFLRGHGERRTGEYRPTGFSELQSVLKKANLETEDLDLFDKGVIPNDCSLLIIAGPSAGIPEQEIRAIRSYLQSKNLKAGQPPALLVMLEPTSPQSQSRPSGLRKLLAEYNVDVIEATRLIDITKSLQLTSQGLQVKERLGFRVAVEEHIKHPVTTDLSGFPTHFTSIACVRPLEQEKNPEFEAKVFLQGTESGWGEMNLRSLYSRRSTANYDEETDIKPPVPFGVAVESKNEKGPRIVVIGDVDFATNQLVQERGNLGLAINSVLWSVRKNNRLGLPPVDPEKTRFQLTRKTEKLVEFASIYGLPGAWILFALGIWTVRTITTSTTDRFLLTLRFGLLVGILLLIIAGIFYSRGFKTSYSAVPGVIGLVLVVFGFVKNLEWVKETVKNRKTLYGANFAVAIALSVVITVIVNYLSTRHYSRWDRTENQFYALSETTIDELKKIDKKVEATLLLPAQMHPLIEHIDAILGEFHRYSRRIGIKRIVATRENEEEINLLKEQLNTPLSIADLPSNIFISGENIKHVTANEVVKIERPQQPMFPGMPPPRQSPPKLLGEEVFLNAVISVTSDQRVNVYFARGNDERDPDSYEEEQFGEFAKLIKRANYAVKTIDLNKKDTIPSDCNILVLAAPKQSYSPQALNIVREHLNNEGSLLVFVEPLAISGIDSGLSSLLSEYDILIEEDTLVIDMQPQVMMTPQGSLRSVKRPSTQVKVDQYGFHNTTRDMEGTAVVFSLACKVNVKEDPNQNQFGGQFGGRPPQGPQGPRSPWTTSKLVNSSDDGWTDRNVGKGDSSVKFDDGTDTKGSAPIAVAVAPNNAPPPPPQGFGGRAPPQPPTPERDGPNIVVFGDADMASNYLVRQFPGNEKLLMNVVRWLGKEKSRDFQIEPKQPDIRPMRVDPESSSLKGAYYISIFGLPILFLLPALLIWIVRRR